MGVSVGNLFKENYKIGDSLFTVTADFDKETLNIRGFHFNYDCSIKEYNGYEGDMRAFVKNRIKVQNNG